MPEKSILQGCLGNIAHQTALMKTCLAEGNLLQALKHCSNFLNELRTNQLSPKQYYELYIAVFDALDTLSTSLLASHRSKQKKNASNGNQTPFLADLYELVQYSGNIIPRLYMMIVIGTTYMSTSEAPAKEIMKDIIEMCRGVQHPIRGLFLRYYLSQRIKDLLPMANEAEFSETVDFLVSNFIEMNKLWVRLQHQGHSSERELRYKERKELKILVGSNLVRLSQIIDDYTGDSSYSSVDYYKTKIFPIITEQIIQCRDHLAQSYLIDVLIQIFPDTFHFATLDALLNDVFINVHPLLNKADLVATLIDRFITYHKFETDANGTVDDVLLLFATFWDFYLKLYDLDPEVPLSEHSVMLQAFIKLSLSYYPDNYSNLDTIYKFAVEKLNLTETKENTEDEQIWLSLLIAPVNHFDSIKNVLKISFFHQFYSKLTNPEYKKQISLQIAQKVLQNPTEVYCETEEIDGIFQYLLYLIKDSDTDLNTAKNLGVTKAIKIDNGEKHITEDFLTVQETLCKIIHLVEHPDTFKSLSNLMYIRKKYLNKNPNNIIYTYPTLISKFLSKLRVAGYTNLRRKGKKGQEDLLITSNFKNLSVIIDELYQHHQEHHSDVVLKIYLNAAGIADQLQQELIAYEFFTQCFIIYEESLILSPALKHGYNPHDTMGGSLLYQSIVMIANKMSTLRYFNRENYENLITKLTLYGSKLMKKQDQCRSVYYCAHLWWWCDLYIKDKSPTVEESEDEVLYRDPKRVLECLQKSLRVADSCIDPYLSLKLFLEILNRCLIFHVYGNHLIDAKYINGLIDLIRTNVDNLKDDTTKNEDDQESKLFRHIEQYFDRTLSYIAEQQMSEDRFAGISV